MLELLRYAIKRVLTDPVFTIAIRKNNDHSQFIYKKISYRYWYADPLIFEHENQIYVFYESYNRIKNKGEIAVSLLTDDVTLTEPKIIISEPFHVSYPCVFKYKGKIYMIPETVSCNQVILYEADLFPHKWKKKKVLFNDVKYADSTIFIQDDLIYLFTSEQCYSDGNKTKLLVFIISENFDVVKVVDQLYDEKLLTCKRGAGNLFIKNNVLYRPAQDCSDNEYGKELIIYKVLKLTTDFYEEVEDYRMTKEDIHIQCFNKHLTGVHTFSSYNNIEIIDIKYNSPTVIVQVLHIFDYINRRMLRGIKPKEEIL